MALLSRLACMTWVVALAVPVAAFHSGGVGSCGGCHRMHEPTPGSRALLNADNPTDLCLRCHDTDNGNTWGRDLLNPGPLYGGGSFIFLLEDNLNDGPGGNDPLNFIRGHQAGHNVLSVIKGVTEDPEFATSPGGDYLSSDLHCTSCHDPHGRGGHFRLLYGSDYPEAKVNGRVFNYTYPAPDAEGIALDGPGETDANHTAFRSALSLWCGNCHGGYHHDGAGVAAPTGTSGTGDIRNIAPGTSPGSGGVLAGAFEHPVDEAVDSSELDMYNRYRGTGLFDGDGSDAYLAAVPLEFSEATTGFRGPVPTGAGITCLSCHRAHASSAPRSGRWDFNIDTWAEEGVLSGSYPIPNPYDSTTGQAQKQLCEKCHGDDVPNW